MPKKEERCLMCCGDSTNISFFKKGPMDTYRVHLSDNAICEVKTTSELNARIRVLAFVKEFGPGDMDIQRKWVDEWRGKTIVKVERIIK